MYRRSFSGFTIVELLIVVVVIAVLAAIVIVSYNGISSRAQETGLKSDLISQSKKLETEKLKSGAMNAVIAGDFQSVSTDNSIISYKYGDLNGQCLELTTIKTPTKQFHITSNGSISEALAGTCPAPTSGVEFRCVAGNISVIVQQTNYTSSDVTFGFTTPYGSSTSTSTAPGVTAASTAFNSRLGSVPKGVATIQVTNPTNPSLSTTRFHPYPAYTC